jgi:hypothetical protein
MGEVKNAYSILVGKGKRPRGRPRMDFRDVGWEGVEWMHLAQDRDQWRALVKRVMNLWVP